MSRPRGGAPRVTRGLLPCTLIIAAVLGPAAGHIQSAAAERPRPFFGANLQTLFQGGLPVESWPRYVRAMSNSGLRLARSDAAWAWVQPQPPEDGQPIYHWARLDHVVATLAEQHVEWLPVLDHAPPWAAGENTRVRRGTYDDFATFSAAVARRYGRRGTFWNRRPELPYLPVRQYEIWNEPNSAEHWPHPDPRAYAEMYRLSRRAILAQDPRAEALASLVWDDVVDFASAFLARTKATRTPVDAIGYHPFAPTTLGVTTNLLRLRKALDRAGGRRIPIDVTELGWPSAYHGRPHRFAIRGPVTDRARASTLSLTTDVLLRAPCGVRKFVVYSWVEREADPTDPEDNTGIYRRAGRHTATSRTLRAAIAREGRRARPRRLGLCAPKVDVRLPLKLKIRPLRGNRCYAARVTYRGEPLEEALIWSTRRVRRERTWRHRRTDAYGRCRVCIMRGAAKRPLALRAYVPRVARSNIVRPRAAPR